MQEGSVDVVKEGNIKKHGKKREFFVVVLHGVEVAVPSVFNNY